MRVTLWGTRGSLATPGPETARYGGNTSCVSVRGRADPGATKAEERTLLTRRLSGIIPSGSRLLRIVWPLLAVVALLALLGAMSIDILSAVRAYVAGEGLWSKAQKDSVYHLYRFAETRAEPDFRRYEEAIAVPLGDRRAREELEKPSPDLAVARQGFLEGRNHPDDIPDMIWLFRRFRNVSYIDKAIGIWAEADRNIGELMRAADALRAQLTGRGDPEEIQAILAQISEANKPGPRPPYQALNTTAAMESW